MTSSTKSKICFFYETSVSLQHRTRLKQFITSLLKKEGRALESLNFVFCTDERLLDINQQYLAHHYYTDIISFELTAKPQPLEGEIYISVDRVRDNALQLGESFKRELHRVIFHGVLHFCGYKDKSARDQQIMRAMEEKYLKRYLG